MGNGPLELMVPIGKYDSGSYNRAVLYKRSYGSRRHVGIDFIANTVLIMAWSLPHSLAGLFRVVLLKCHRRVAIVLIPSRRPH